MNEPKIYVAGHNGMVGSAVVSTFSENGYTNLITKPKKELDLRKQADVDRFISRQKPDAIILAAAKVGGILANDQYSYEFLYDNLCIQNNIINAAQAYDVERLIFLGSSCIYPKLAPQPLKEEYLLTGALEPTNQWYAVAKIAGIKLCQALNKQYGRNYITLMPTNLYGPGDNFDLQTSHVVPAMLRKFHEAKVNGDQPVTLWGSGRPKREFLHVKDMADAVLFAFENNIEGDLYNVGCGEDLSIRELAEMIQGIVGHKGNIVWDESKPDGTPRKLLDVSKLAAKGWQYQIDLQKGLEQTYQWYKNYAPKAEMEKV